MSESGHYEFENSFLETLSHETPFFLFSRKKIADNSKEFKKFFPGASIRYAMKANAEPQVIKVILKEGDGFEVASRYELYILKEEKVPPAKIFYGTSVKPASHIKEFFDYGVDTFAFDSLSELEKIASMAPGAKVYVRVAVNDKGSVFKFSEKFGTVKESIVPFLERAKELGLCPSGVSFHVGSQAGNVMAWAHALEGFGEIMNQLSLMGITLEMINLGGGFPCNNYLSSAAPLPLEDIARHTLEQYKKLPYQPSLVIEPGRRIVADAAVIVASVIARVDRQEHTWLFLDVGVYSGLFESMVYQGSTRYRITAMRQTPGVEELSFALAGPTGDSQDIITREVLLPRDIDVGDKIIIHDIGAYSLPATCPFNGFPRPDVYFID